MNLGGTVRVNPVGVAVVIVVLVIGLLYMLSGPKKHHLSHVVINQHYESEGKLSLRTLLSVAIDAAQRGGKEVKSVRLNSDLDATVKGQTKEGKDELATKGDSQSNIRMFYTIKNVYPSIKLISEEKDRGNPKIPDVVKADGKNAEVLDLIKDDEYVPIGDVTVWIDPLDATQEYFENLTNYVTTMVCVAVKGKPVIGVIYKPFEDKTAWAWTGHGHAPYLSTTLSKRPKETFIVSRSHTGQGKKVVQEAFGSETEVIEAGGAGFKSLEVVQGKVDAYVHVTLIKKWDICAGNAIISEFGGRMTTLKGESIDYSADSDVKNHGGLIAALTDHESYVSKLSSVKT